MADIRPALLRDRLGDRPCRLACRLPPPALLFPRSSYEGQISSSPHRHRPRRRVLRQCLRRRIRPLRCLADGYLQTVDEHAALAGRAGPTARGADDAGREDRDGARRRLSVRSTQPASPASVPANTRLGIPALYLADSPVGVGNGSTGVTQWADTSALASTWDTSLASAYGSAYGAEQAGKGHNIALMPTINILRLPLWGRAPGDVQRGPVPDRAPGGRGDPRHPEQARHRHREALRRQQPGGAAQLTSTWWRPSARLHEIYQPAFKMAVQQGGVGAVMCSYNRVNGTYACENARGADRRPARCLEVRRPRHVGLGRAAQHGQGRAVRAWTWRCPAWPSETNPTPIDQIFGVRTSTASCKAAVLDGAVPEATLDAHGHAHPHRDVPDRAVRPPAARPRRASRTRS